ncbi:MAG: hypothetical protein ACI8Y8_004416, partial [Planctomycetota bacterium]
MRPSALIEKSAPLVPRLSGPGCVASIVLAAACGSCADSDRAAPAGSGKASENIVIVTIDTLRADHLGCYGYFRDTSPRIDELADESILFERCISPMATT